MGKCTECGQEVTDNNTLKNKLTYQYNFYGKDYFNNNLSSCLNKFITIFEEHEGVKSDEKSYSFKGDAVC